MKKVLLSFLFSSFIYADTVGGEMSVGLFYHDVEGINTQGVSFSDTQDIFFSASLELPFPLMPNIKFSNTSLSHDNDSSNGLERANLTLKYTDATLYYEVLDTWLELDLGATLRYVKGNIQLPSFVLNNTTSYTHSIPLLYAKGRFNIPTTDLSIQLETNALTFSDINSYDYALSARYSFTMGLGVEAGYKSFHLDGDVSSLGSENDLDFSGIYTAVIWDF